MMHATILICTYNRASLLGPTLDSVASLQCSPDLRWEVLVVDNNSSDGTKEVVEQRQSAFPVPLTYCFEERQGKSFALNTGFQHAAGAIIVYTDDDVRLPAGWLESAVRPLLTRCDVDYTGGPVRPIWERRPPRWLEPFGNLGGTIAVKDHGNATFVFEDRRKTPLGVSLAVRRELIERVGGFRTDLGRTGGSLLGQEQAEFFYRTRAAGARGLYVPDMVLEHHVPARRLTHNYFRRWWYWKGISQARVHRMHGRTELGVDLTHVRRVGGVPLFILRCFIADALAAVRALLAGRLSTAVEREMMAWYAVGYAVEQIRTWRSPARERPHNSAAPAQPGDDAETARTM
jgi:glycosyltransferase involved in cell wall biosynthesis